MLLPLPQAHLSCPALGSTPLATVATIHKAAKRNPLASDIQSRSLHLTAPLEKRTVPVGNKHSPHRPSGHLSGHQCQAAQGSQASRIPSHQ